MRTKNWHGQLDAQLKMSNISHSNYFTHLIEYCVNHSLHNSHLHLSNLQRLNHSNDWMTKHIKKLYVVIHSSIFLSSCLFLSVSISLKQWNIWPWYYVPVYIIVFKVLYQYLLDVSGTRSDLMDLSYGTWFFRMNEATHINSSYNRGTGTIGILKHITHTHVISSANIP